jgi:hypothetical protein
VRRGVRRCVPRRRRRSPCMAESPASVGSTTQSRPRSSSPSRRGDLCVCQESPSSVGSVTQSRPLLMSRVAHCVRRVNHPHRVGLRSMSRVALVRRVRHAESASAYVRIALVRRVRRVERPLARDTSETRRRRAFGGASARLSIEASRNVVSCKEWLPRPLGSNCHAARSRISRSKRAAHAPRSFLDARDRPPWQRAPTDARRSHTHACLLRAVARSRGRAVARAPRSS